MQTTRAIVSLVIRFTLLGIALPVLLRDFPGYMLPSRIMTDWATLTAVDALAMLAPLGRWRKYSLLGGVAAVSAHYFFRHQVPVLDMGYLVLAIFLVLLPESGRAEAGKKRPSLAPQSRISRLG